MQISYLGNSDFLVIGQNTLSQLDCNIFKSAISQEQIDELA